MFDIRVGRVLASMGNDRQLPQLFNPAQFELILAHPPQRSVAEVVVAHSLLFLIAAIVCLTGLPL